MKKPATEMAGDASHDSLPAPARATRTAPPPGIPNQPPWTPQANAALDAALREAGPDPVTRAAIEHAFHAERRTWRIPELEQARPRRLERVGVVGGGTMGAGIAVALLDAGCRW